MDDLIPFMEWNKQIYKSQEENELIDLYYLEINGETIATFLSNILCRKANIHPFPYSIFKIHDEFIAISKDIKYFGGILFFLRPFIINTELNDGRYIQNLPDSRYLVYLNFAIQSVYNFWDRIGDMLYLYFPSKIKSDAVYFGRIFSVIPDQYKSTKPYLELQNLYNNIKSLLELRHKSVHYFQFETHHQWGNIEHINNDEERNKLNLEKFIYPEKFKQALEICNQAFVVALNLINQLPDKQQDLVIQTTSS